MPQILIVANTPSDNCQRCFDACTAGARSGGDNISVVAKTPLLANSQDVLNCDGIIIGSTENFGAMSGLIKDFFERIYYPCLEQSEGLAVAVYIKAGLDGEGAKNGIERIVTGLKWKPIQPTLILKGSFQEVFLSECHELSGAMAAGLELGIF
jgi:multimeric flavodoxin WrbA